MTGQAMPQHIPSGVGIGIDERLNGFEQHRVEGWKACHGTCSICDEVYVSILMCSDDDAGQGLADGTGGWGRGCCIGGEIGNHIFGPAVVCCWVYGMHGVHGGQERGVTPCTTGGLMDAGDGG